MRYLSALIAMSGCAYPFDHTEAVNVGPDPFVVDGNCVPRPLETVRQDDGSVTSTKTEAIAGGCRFTGTWKGSVLDLEEDLQSQIADWNDVVAIFWQNSKIKLTAADVREDGGGWEDVRSQPWPGVAVSATATLYADEPPAEPAVTLAVPAPGDGEPTESIHHGQLLTAVEDGWYGQDPRLPVMALATGTVEVDNAALAAHAGHEVEVRLGLDLTVAGVLCVFGVEPEAGSHDVASGCGEPAE